MMRTKPTWDQAQGEALEYFHRMLYAARRQDLAFLQQQAAKAHPLCVTSDMDPGGDLLAEGCDTCPVGEQYGNCRLLIIRAVKSAEQGNWEAAQLLLLSLIAEVAGVQPPTSE
jgi:hypothetical protein